MHMINSVGQWTVIFDNITSVAMTKHAMACLTTKIIFPG